MSRATRTRAISRAAALGGGGLVGLGSMVFGVLVGEAWLARRAIGPVTEAPLDADGRYLPPDGAPGEGSVGQARSSELRLAVLGDSGAAGLGVEQADQTTGAFMAAGLAAAAGRPVELRCLAVVGAQSVDLATQVDAALAWSPDVVAVIVGANDVTHAVPPGRSVALLTTAVRQLRANDCGVVVGTCPDLGTIRPIPHPLKLVARQWSRSLAAAQMVGVVEADGRAVALADLLGAEVDAHPEVYFGPDRFHPSVAGYRAVAEVMVPSLLAALAPDAEPDIGSLEPDRRVHDLAEAAAAAADVAGTEVSEAAPARDWRFARLVALRRRPRASTPDHALREDPSQLQP